MRKTLHRIVIFLSRFNHSISHAALHPPQSPEQTTILSERPYNVANVSLFFLPAVSVHAHQFATVGREQPHKRRLISFHAKTSPLIWWVTCVTTEVSKVKPIGTTTYLYLIREMGGSRVRRKSLVVFSRCRICCFRCVALHSSPLHPLVW